ncbi:hypothetical protein F5X96DRAFT_675123 [Biscogniauxia mediterranea]|nr:hypothetical protein F5X96DRAFT_675123 [Biscogniauxia mediterranea]
MPIGYRPLMRGLSLLSPARWLTPFPHPPPLGESVARDWAVSRSSGDGRVAVGALSWLQIGLTMATGTGDWVSDGGGDP